MNDLAARIGRLSPEQRSALLVRLAGARPARDHALGPAAEPGEHVPLLPAQRIMLDRLAAYGVNPNKYNITSLVRVSDQLRDESARTALAGVVAWHDALRLRFGQDGGEWYQEVVAPPDDVPFQTVDLSNTPTETCLEVMSRAARELQDQLDLASGPVLRLVLFRLPGDESRLLLVVHHLIADAYSIGVLWRDFWTAYQQLERGEAIALPPATSFTAWVRRLHAYAESPDFDRDSRYWSDSRWDRVTALPVHQEARPPGGSLVSTDTSLPAADVTALLGALPPGSQLPEAVLAAVLTAVGRWTGSAVFAPLVVRHGRASSFDGADLSNTVGWLSVHPPVFLDLTEVATPLAAVRTVAEQLRQMPLDGTPWEWLGERTAAGYGPAWLSRLDRTRVIFDYLGAGTELPTGLRPAPEDVDGASGAPHVWGDRTLLVACRVADGELRLRFGYDERTYRSSTVDSVAEDTMAVLRTLAHPGI